MINKKNLFVILTIIIAVSPLNFPLGKARQTCFVITKGFYEFQYVVSGHSEKNVRCEISQGGSHIMTILQKSEFQGEFEVKQNQGSICFSSLDSMAKSVSMDFFNTDDPLRGVIKDEQKLKVHQDLYKSYQQLQKVYRDQHFLIESNLIHSLVLKQAQVVVVLFMLLKIIVVFFCACFQFYMVKQILQEKFKPLPTEQPMS